MVRLHRRGRMVWLACAMTGAIITVTGCSAGGAAGGPGGDTTADDQVDDDMNRDDQDDQANLVAREIEEADIVKYDSGYLYLANRYRGLRIIDVGAIERPQIVGGADATGRGVELYVYGDHVFLVTSADQFYCAGEPVGFDDASVGDSFVRPGYTGSRLWVYDVSDPSNPSLVVPFAINGYVTATRRVGEVIYLAANELEDTDPPDDVSTNGADPSDPDGEAVLPPILANSVLVLSIDISDPANPQSANRERIYGAALEVMATPTAMYVAGPDPDLTDTTRITYVDISDPAGEMEIRDTFRVPGLIRNRFFMDEHGNVFRVVTQERMQVSPFEFRDVAALYNYDITNPNDIKRVSRLPIETDEDVWAVRFDGARGYVVTFRQVDPLFVLDLSSALDPQIAGELVVPGFSTHLVPLGDRLVAVGFDGTFNLRPAVALYDVSRPWVPQLMSRVVIGQQDMSSVMSEATYDEKALRVLEDEGLILVPFSYFNEETLEWVDSVQIIDLQPTRLLQRGKADHRGLVRRADVLDERLWMLSDEAFGVVDIDNRDAPSAIAHLDIITEQELLDAGLADCVDSARFRDTPVVVFWPIIDVWMPYPVLCGAVSYASLAMLLAGMTLLRTRRRVSSVRRPLRAFQARDP
ncbi:MAG: beta-propeller domain-containing protein [Phycisphaerales bacterium]|nr:MAG: beta-propeller domain-containing protein [Phycisphaerales bacterium]